MSDAARGEEAGSVEQERRNVAAQMDVDDGEHVELLDAYEAAVRKAERSRTLAEVRKAVLAVDMRDFRNDLLDALHALEATPNGQPLGFITREDVYAVIWAADGQEMESNSEEDVARVARLRSLADRLAALRTLEDTP